MPRERSEDRAFGPGFDTEQLKSPLYVGPSKGQEGWTPANPEIPEASDPLGYIPPESPKRDRY